MTTDGEGALSGAEGTQGGAGEDTSGQNSGGADTSGTGAQGGTDQQAQTSVSKAELDQQRERTRAADARAAKFEAELKQLRDKDLPEHEKLLRDHQEAVKQNEALQETNRALALKVAFLSDNSVTWHNPERALKLVDLSNVEIDADGNVTGLKDALTALAKSDAYLVKTEKESETSTTPPATAPGTNGANGTGKPSTKALSSRFPALNTRVRR